MNKLLHLQDFDIPIDEKERKHLVITGRNGSGKTILVNEILEFLEHINKDESLNFLKYRERLKYWEDSLLALNADSNSNSNSNSNKGKVFSTEDSVEFYRKAVNSVYGKLELSFNDIEEISKKYRKGDFIIAFYEAERRTEMHEPKSPMKPDLEPIKELKQSKVDQFLLFLVDYKIKEALARNEKQNEDADRINCWFDSFIELLKEIFEDKYLKLIFNYHDYSFRIESQGKLFKFTELAAGYSAVLGIVADLILKMQSPNSLLRVYEKQGIVLIDEIETHLHLELQRLILPILTRIFPNIQFIVTTHSPFILNSIPNIVAFDLERREPITDLTAYSYESLAEGYFGVKTESSNMQLRLQRLNELVKKNTLTASENVELTELMNDFEKIPEAVAPGIKTAYYQLRLQWNNKEAVL